MKCHVILCALLVGASVPANQAFNTAGGGFRGLRESNGKADEQQQQQLYSDKLKQIEELTKEISDDFAGVISILPMSAIDNSFDSKQNSSATSAMKYFAVGESNRENSIKYKNEAVFPIGSNTKLYVAVAMYQLQERGVLNVTDFVNDYITAKDFASFNARGNSTFSEKDGRWCPRINGSTSTECQNISFVNLMEMSSGIVHPLNCDDGNLEAPYCFWKNTDIYQYSGAIKDYIGLFINEPLMFAPGAKYSYANSNWNLLSFIIEKLTGMTLGDYMSENIFKHILPEKRARGENTIMYDPFAGQFQFVKNRVDSYRKYVNGDTNATMSVGSCRPFLAPGLANGAGGFWATTEAHVEFYRLLFNGPKLGGPILSDASVREILKPRMATTPAAKYFFGQGITVRYQYENSTFPAAISYCGGIDCTSTCIVQTKDGIFTSFSTLDIATMSSQDYEELHHTSVLTSLFDGVLGDALTENIAAAVLGEVVTIWEQPSTSGKST